MDRASSGPEVGHSKLTESHPLNHSKCHAPAKVVQKRVKRFWLTARFARGSAKSVSSLESLLQAGRADTRCPGAVVAGFFEANSSSKTVLFTLPSNKPPHDLPHSVNFSVVKEDKAQGAPAEQRLQYSIRNIIAATQKSDGRAGMTFCSLGVVR